MKVIDLTMKVSQESKVFPGSPKPSFIPWSTFESHGYDSEVMHISTHTGTHMDAPSHFAPGRQTIDQISPSRLVCDALLIRVSKKPNQTIDLDDIEDEVKEGDTLVFATAWENQYESDHYMTTNPGLSREVAQYLVERKVNAVAIDAPNIDPGHDTRFTAHKILLPAGVFVVENLCNLAKISRTRFTLIVAPLKLAGASGSPIRALAIF